MSLASLLNQPVTVKNFGVTGTDSLGNETFGVTATTSTVGYVEQDQQSEVTGDQNTEVVDWTVWLPFGTVVGGRDRIEVGPIELEVIGPPDAVWNPRTQTNSHIRLKARSVNG